MWAVRTIRQILTIKCSHKCWCWVAECVCCSCLDVPCAPRRTCHRRRRLANPVLIRAVGDSHNGGLISELLCPMLGVWRTSQTTLRAMRVMMVATMTAGREGLGTLCVSCAVTCSYIWGKTDLCGTSWPGLLAGSCFSCASPYSPYSEMSCSSRRSRSRVSSTPLSLFPTLLHLEYGKMPGIGSV